MLMIMSGLHLRLCNSLSLTRANFIIRLCDMDEIQNHKAQAKGRKFDVYILIEIVVLDTV